jgi:putative molybdopterin biosynthesis protein
MPEQEQFLHVLDRDEAERRFRAALDLTPRGVECVPLDAARGRVVAADGVVRPLERRRFCRRLRGHLRRVRRGPAFGPAR